MASRAPVLLVVVLLVATASAFVVTEKLKLTKNPIRAPQITKVFSPVCSCPKDTASIAFRLVDGDDLGVAIVRDGDNDRVVRHLVEPRPTRKGGVHFVWDGRDDRGVVVPDGIYHPRLRLERTRRTIVMPNRIEVDTRRPVVLLVGLKPRVFSPDGDRRFDYVTLRYEIDEKASALLLVNDVQRVRKFGTRRQGAIRWSGTIGGRAVPAGPYALSIGAVDRAGNQARPTRPRVVTVRYVALGRTRIEATPGSRIAVFVSSDARRVAWRLFASRGITRPGTLVVRAPVRPGRYTLVVSANDHAARAAVIVAGAAP